MDAGLFAAFAAVRAAIADQPAAAGGAGCAIMGLISFTFRKRADEAVSQMEVNRFAGIVHTGFMGHDALNPFVGQMVPFAVFDKNSTGLDETEGHIMGNAFSAQLFYPVKIAGPCAVIIFAPADDLLDLTAFQVGFYGDGTDEGGTHNSLVLKWKIKQDRTRWGRLVSKKNFTSGRWRMISQASSRHSSASSKKKSEVIQTRINSPLWIL